MFPHHFVSANASSYALDQDQTIDEKQLKLKALRVVQRLMKRGLVLALARWREQTFAQAEEERVSVSWKDAVLQIGLRWTTVELSAVVRQWRETSKLLRSSEIHYNRARRRVIWNRKRATMLEWSVYTYEARRLWHAGSVLLSRWTSAVLASVISHW